MSRTLLFRRCSEQIFVAAMLVASGHPARAQRPPVTTPDDAVRQKSESGSAAKAAEPPADPRNDPADIRAGRAAERHSADWQYDAKWYELSVPRFHNGDRSNDPTGTLAWAWNGPADDAVPFRTTVEAKAVRRYGGDLEGVALRLPYLKALGVNSLILSHIPGLFDADVHDSSAQAKQMASGRNGIGRPFGAFLRRAHADGFRVAVRLPTSAGPPNRTSRNEARRAAEKTVRRWTTVSDENGQHGQGTRDGVDAWVGEPTALDDRLRELVHNINPHVPVIAAVPIRTDRADRRGAIDNRIMDALARCFAPVGGPASIEPLFETVNTVHGSTRGQIINALQSPMRLLSRLSSGRSSTTGASPGPPVIERTPPSADAIERWRLTTVCAHFLPGAPLTFYGDEVGMYAQDGLMWWNDLGEPVSRSPHYREDFFALIQWLHGMRDKYPVIRRGAFKPVLDDATKKLFAFSRYMPGEEIVLVVNYGDSKQEVWVPIGAPGAMVAAVTPRIRVREARAHRARLRGNGAAVPEPVVPRNHTEIPPLTAGGNRQFVSDNGKTRIWIGRESVRVLITRPQ